MSKKIVIDPGHGGNGHLTKYGASGNGIDEKDFVLDVGKRLQTELTSNYDCEAVLTRDGDYDVSFSDRAAYGRGAERLISLHANGFHISAANGFETFIYNGSLKPETTQYQRTVHQAIHAYLKTHGVRDRGMKQANFAMLRLPPCPCLLVEYLFLTNPSDAALAKQRTIRQKLAQYTAMSIAADANLPKKSKPEPPKPPEPPTGDLPVVQRQIGVEIDGKMTNIPAYLIDGSTYIHGAPLVRALGYQISGHGDHVKIGK